EDGLDPRLVDFIEQPVDRQRLGAALKRVRAARAADTRSLDLDGDRGPTVCDLWLADRHGRDRPALPGGVGPAVAEVLHREVAPEEGLAPLGGFNPLVDVLTDTPVLVFAGE